MLVEKKESKAGKLEFSILAAFMVVLFLGSLSVSLDARADPKKENRSSSQSTLTTHP
jgi:hypothetical protein